MSLEAHLEISELRPGDVLLYPATGYWGLQRLLMRYGHSAVYYGQTKRDLPLVIESIGRGVMIRSLLADGVAAITVMRCPQADGFAVADAAERLADNPASWYDYLDIPRFVLPKLLTIKLSALLPAWLRDRLLAMARAYQRNPAFICSELVDEAYLSAGYQLLDAETIPLPDDLAASPHLINVGVLRIDDVLAPPGVPAPALPG